MSIPHRTCKKHTCLFIIYLFLFAPEVSTFLSMVRYRIYSVYVHFGLNAELYFQYSHPIFLRGMNLYCIILRICLDRSISALRSE